MKRALSIAVLFTLVISLCICAVGCKTNSENNDDSGSYSDVVPGGLTDVSKEVLEALTKSGDVVSYVFTDDDTAGRPLELGGLNNEEFTTRFEQIYGGNLELKRIEWEKWEEKFINDFAAEEAPDIIYGFSKLWPKIANRKMVYSLNDLEEMGIVGTDHPLLKEDFDAVSSNFTYKNEVYGLALHRSGCFWGIVNEDLYDKYGVKSPSEYYQEGLWNLDTLKKASKELQDAAGLGDAGTRDVYAYYCWDYTTFVRANGQQLVGYDPATGNLTNNLEKLEVIEALESVQEAYNSTDGYATKTNRFAAGYTSMNFVADENIPNTVKDLTFNWSIVPYPKGKSNKNNQLPGSVSAWMVTTCSDNPQGAVNLVIAYLACIKDSSLPLGDNCVEVALKDRPEELQMILDNKINGVNDNLYGVGTLWGKQWDFWNAVMRGNQSISEVVNQFKSMFDAQIEGEMSYSEE